MTDAQDPYEHEEYAMGENIQVRNAEIESNGRRYQETLPDIVATMRSLRVEMQSYREYNQIMIKAQEEKNQLNAPMLQSLTDIQRKMTSGHREVNTEGSRGSARRSKTSYGGSSNSEGSTSGSSSSSHGNERKRRYQNHSRDEFKKERPPTFCHIPQICNDTLCLKRNYILFLL